MNKDMGVASLMSKEIRAECWRAKASAYLEMCKAFLSHLSKKISAKVCDKSICQIYLRAVTKSRQLGCRHSCVRKHDWPAPWLVDSNFSLGGQSISCTSLVWGEAFFPMRSTK